MTTSSPNQDPFLETLYIQLSIFVPSVLLFAMQGDVRLLYVLPSAALYLTVIYSVLLLPFLFIDTLVLRLVISNMHWIALFSSELALVIVTLDASQLFFSHSNVAFDLSVLLDKMGQAALFTTIYFLLSLLARRLLSRLGR